MTTANESRQPSPVEPSAYARLAVSAACLVVAVATHPAITLLVENRVYPGRVADLEGSLTADA